MKKTFLSAIFILLSTFTYAQNDWKFVKNTEGIKVYNKKVGNLKDVKIELTFDCEMSTLIEVLMDIPNFPKWIYKVKYSKFIKNMGHNQRLYYNQIDMPWPVKDRDMVGMSKITQNPVTKEVVLEDIGQNKGMPINPDYLRVTDFHAKWILTPTSNGIKGVYTLHSDPAGELPDVVINMFVDEGPVNSMKALKKMIKEKKYIQSSSYGIIN
ncbi:MAG: hypothetical protein LCH67_16145 [Bacteroidetes bacterium]|nr:hypothetical protein [Bacteroidota bacterium]